MRSRLFSGLVLCGLLAACGGDDKGGDGGADTSTPQGKAQAAIQQMFELVRAKDRASLAKYLAYRGRDEARKWKDSYDYGTPDEKSSVDVRYARIESLLLGGPATFDSFESQIQSEGTWLVWKVSFGKKAAAFACLDVGDKILLGDLDLIKSK